MLTIDLSDTAALVTGGSSGVGAGCVRSLQEAGAFVVSLDVTAPQTSTPDAFVVGDVTDLEVRQECVGMLGRDRSLLVNNAGVQLEKRLGDTSSVEIHRLVAVNVISAMELTALYATHAPPGSSVVNMCSVLSVTGDPALAAYTVTKGALLNFTRTAALEYAGRLRVNAVMPGAIRTPLTTRAWAAAADPADAERRQTALYPAGRIGEPDDVGPVVAFLASPLASFISGAMVTVDGGLLAANAEWALERL